MKIVIDATIEAISSRVDGTVNIKIGTQELDANKAGELFGLRGKYVKILLSDNNISKVEEELVDNTNIAQTGKQKTASQRLRSVLYIQHQQSNIDLDFEQFYKIEMEKLITVIKSKLQ